MMSIPLVVVTAREMEDRKKKIQVLEEHTFCCMHMMATYST